MTVACAWRTTRTALIEYKRLATTAQSFGMEMHLLLRLPR
jgi:hypothetical protein